MKDQKINNICYKVFFYFVIGIFLAPKGHISYILEYKQIISALTWIAVFCIWCQFAIEFFRFKVRKNLLFIFNYFFVAIVLSIIVRKQVDSGLQQLIAFPSLCVFIIGNMKKRMKVLLDVIIDVCIINFSLNLFVDREFFSLQYHVTFLGHVQLIAQLGVLAFFSVCIYIYMYDTKKYKCYLLLFLTLINLFTNDASASMVCACIIIIFLGMLKFQKYKIMEYNSKVYIILGILLSIICVYIAGKQIHIYNHTWVWNFSGRSFVWSSAWGKIKESIIYGYGIDGVKISVFWLSWAQGSAADGFNYMHNQILQNLADGGIILLILFWNMFFEFCKILEYVKKNILKVISNMAIFLFMLIMISESATLYCYMFMILSLIYGLSVATEVELIENKKRKE